MRIYRFLNLFVVGLVIWFCLTFPLGLAELITGAVVSCVASLLVLPIIPWKIDVLNPRRLAGLLLYLPVFIWELIKANFKIAYVVLHPRLPVNPAILKVKTSLKSKFSRTMLANSITLTPGTLTVEIDDDHLFIHLVEEPENLAQSRTGNKGKDNTIVEPFEKYIKKIGE
ncbi:MAG: Na+/H+ antiporter subunit E [Deltaproteobacteria bacterium]|jgi:multicomponent Na+:H+ antiporter subunit E|nr:Na+/H+ antiporter subunit E [Deltaproteobacteria bacterium]